LQNLLQGFQQYLFVERLLQIGYGSLGSGLGFQPGVM
jgi:hypothetical protein